MVSFKFHTPPQKDIPYLLAERGEQPHGNLAVVLQLTFPRSLFIPLFVLGF